MSAAVLQVPPPERVGGWAEPTAEPFPVNSAGKREPVVRPAEQLPGLRVCVLASRSLLSRSLLLRPGSSLAGFFFLITYFLCLPPPPGTLHSPFLLTSSFLRFSWAGEEGREGYEPERISVEEKIS